MGFHLKQLIDGQWCDASGGGSWDVINPATEEAVATVPFGDAADCRAAIDAAKKAFPGWSSKTAYERSAILFKAAQLIRERLQELAPINTSESGKTKGDAEGDLHAAAALLEWFAEEGKRAYGRTIPARKPGKRILVLKQPIGVVGTITAWNFPAYNPVRSWAAALAAGCTVVARPSEYTPMTAMAIAELLVDSGLPAGVLNLINGEPESMGQEMLDNPACRKIAFTGSTRVGKILLDGASRTMTRLSLELGGNAPVLIFPDADLDVLAKQVPMAKCRNVGQVCVAPQRFIIHQKIKDEFVERVATGMKALRVGNGADPGVEVGPLINAKQRDRVEELVHDARDRGARIAAGGNRPGNLGKGYFFEPTLIADYPEESRISTEEIFGPVLPVASFDDVDEVIARANATPYGLAAYVFTRDLNTAIRAYEGLEFGLVSVNDWNVSTIEGPFPGWKQSGQGRECGQEGLEDYLEVKQVGIGGLGF
ncbi:MAG: NAD-dependent succinate-semialdehyde dehydrogenase [Candidatus Sumerlaeia bacterium]|nr:NAD-dependent succinate-semialdehyde dehydrogenase [Candidatus Sumerlaeia bacterium]